MGNPARSSASAASRLDGRARGRARATCKATLRDGAARARRDRLRHGRPRRRPGVGPVDVAFRLERNEFRGRDDAAGPDGRDRAGHRSRG